MSHRVRGAGEVSVMWVIVLFILLAAAAFGMYSKMSEQAGYIDQIEKLQVERDRVSERVTEVSGEMKALTDVVGFKDAADAMSFSNVTQIQGKLTSLGETYDFVNSTDLSGVIDALATNRDSLDQEVTKLKDQVQAANDARSALQAGIGDQLAQKDTQINDLRQNLQDERDRAAAQEQQDADRITALQSQVQDAQSRASAAQDEAASSVAQVEDQLKMRDARIAELSQKVELMGSPDRPDGEILAVSSVGTCYIDLGKKNLLQRGTRFEVFRHGKGGDVISKGLIEVRKVGELESEAGIVQSYSQFDPIAAGDMIAAPTFDREMKREFVLLGRFPSGYSREVVASRLRSLGADVAETVSASTDVLVLGDAERQDDSDEEESSDPLDSDAYRLAQFYKVQILPAREIIDFVRYD